MNEPTNDLPIDVVALYDGTVLEVHRHESCVGQSCCVHTPSDHPLRDAPLFWCADVGAMSRVCSHGEHHPDPDDVVFRVFGVTRRHQERKMCDGCCRRGHDERN